MDYQFEVKELGSAEDTKGDCLTCIYNKHFNGAIPDMFYYVNFDRSLEKCRKCCHVPNTPANKDYRRPEHAD